MPCGDQRAQVCPAQIGEFKIGISQVGIAQVSVVEVGTEKIGLFKMDALKECLGYINGDQRDVIVIQLGEGVVSSAAAAFALGGIDNLPRLVMAHLRAFAGFGEVEDDGDQDGEAAGIFQNFQQGPSAQEKRDPIADEFGGDERKDERVPASLPEFLPWLWPPAMGMKVRHDFVIGGFDHLRKNG